MYFNNTKRSVLIIFPFFIILAISVRFDGKVLHSSVVCCFFLLHAVGLQTSENLKFYAISSRFKPFNNKGRPLVIQYTVKHEQKIDCGGGYVKIFPSNLDQKNMSGESLYYIMFGELIWAVSG